MRILLKALICMMILSPICCSDFIEKSILDKDFEQGRWDSSKWDKATWR